MVQAGVHNTSKQGRYELTTWQNTMHDSRDCTQCLQQLLADSLAGDLPAAGFGVHYQPIVRLTDGAVIAVEALARWKHARLGEIEPKYFIAQAESDGLIDVIDQFVLERACTDADALSLLHDRQVDIHVNVSARRFGHGGIELALDRVLHRGQVRPEQLVLEITETAEIENAEAAAATARRIRQRGVRLALDDFGAGFSWLRRLHELPVDVLKLDASVTHAPREQHTESLCQVLVALGRTMDLTIVAEGIESEQQARELEQLGCETGQGYFYGVPAPLIRFAPLLPAASSW